MTDYQKYINALRKCAKEHKNDRTSFGHIRVSDLCTDTANLLEELEQEPKTEHCKDCKWWKDSDGEYRRGCGAESQCPINTHAVYCGEGYCYMFSPRGEMREVEE